jgi:hydrogenase maturation protease
MQLEPGVTGSGTQHAQPCIRELSQTDRLVRINTEHGSLPVVRVLVLGVGNPILSDDGVGIHAARRLKEKNLSGVDVEELAASGLELLDLVLDYDKVIIIDAIQTTSGTPGETHILAEKDFERAVHGSSPHGINIATALALGRRIVPERMPKKVVFIAVEVEDLVNVKERLTARVEAALPDIVMKAEDEIKRS